MSYNSLINLIDNSEELCFINYLINALFCHLVYVPECQITGLFWPPSRLFSSHSCHSYLAFSTAGEQPFDALVGQPEFSLKD